MRGRDRGRDRAGLGGIGQARGGGWDNHHGIVRNPVVVLPPYPALLRDGIRRDNRDA